jgi:threonine aldolase
MAEKLREMFISRGYSLFIDSPTNQQFIIIEDSRLEEIKKQVRYDYWERYDETRSVVRFATSWATTDEDLERLAEII